MIYWFIILVMIYRCIINRWFIDLWLTYDLDWFGCHITWPKCQILAFGPHYMAWMGLLCVLNGLESRQKILMGFNSFFIFIFEVGPWFGLPLGPKSSWAKRGPQGPTKKNLFNNWVGSRLRVWARGSGLGMKKLSPLPFLVKVPLSSPILGWVVWQEQVQKGNQSPT